MQNQQLTSVDKSLRLNFALNLFFSAKLTFVIDKLMRPIEILQQICLGLRLNYAPNQHIDSTNLSLGLRDTPNQRVH